MESKRKIKKATGLDADELSRAYYSIKNWRSVLDREIGDEDEDTPAQLDKVDDFILLMERRMSAVRNANFSSAYEKDLYFKLLDSMNLRPLPGGLQLKDRATLREKVSQIHEAGSTHFMSAQNFYDKLSLLETHILPDSPTCGRLWIESFLFRVLAITYNEDCSNLMMIDLEFNSHSQNPLQQSPPSIGGGLIDYFVFTVDKKYRRASTLEHNLETLITHGVPIRGLCVIEAKTTSILLRHHIGRAVAEMRACGLHLGYTTIRGALTNGKSWIFLILTLDEKGGGGVWSASRHFDIHHDHHPTTNLEKVNEDSVNIIVGILAYWAEHCVESLTDDDWFEKTEDN